MYHKLSRYENGFGEYEIEMIRKGYEEGLSSEQIAIYARPDFCGEEMEVLFQGIKAGLSDEQLQFIAESDTDWTEKEKICIGFLLGMTFDDMKEAFAKGEACYEAIDSRIELLLNVFAKEKTPIANEIAEGYEKEREEVSSQATILLEVFYFKYIKEGYRYSGCVNKEELLRAGYQEEDLQELMDRGMVSRRDSKVESYELSVMERYCLIKNHDVLKKWEEHGGEDFRLNHGYYGEFHRVLREVLKYAEGKGMSNERKNSLDSMISKGQEKVQEQSFKQAGRENDRELGL